MRMSTTTSLLLSKIIIPKEKQKNNNNNNNNLVSVRRHPSCSSPFIRNTSLSVTTSASATTPESIKLTYTADEEEEVEEEFEEEQQVQVNSSKESTSLELELLELGCPICYYPLTPTNTQTDDSPPLSLESTITSLECSSCKKVYNFIRIYFDLTTASGAKDYFESKPLVTQFFSTQFMSYLYERGWRQNFGLGGYPGPDKEFEMAKDFLKQVLGGNIVDASCGSGVFSRRFAKSGLFSRVVALDYSGPMLKQCYDFVKDDPDFPRQKLVLVRADIARLPFVSQSVDAVHAGAALHCWPSPSAAVAEICRVLRPGGVFVATTTIADGPFALLPFRGVFRENLQQFAGSRVFLSELELEDLCATCGLVSFACIRNGPFIMISATKPC